MIKKIEYPNYGDIKKSKVKFALLPKVIKLEDKSEVKIWLEKYVDVYIYTRQLRVDLCDWWRYVYSEIVEDKYGKI